MKGLDAVTAELVALFEAEKILHAAPVLTSERSQPLAGG